MNSYMAGAEQRTLYTCQSLCILQTLKLWCPQSRCASDNSDWAEWGNSRDSL